MPAHWKACFFDLDGTLVQTSPEIADAVNATLRHFNWPEVTQAQVDGWIGQGTRELLILALSCVTEQTVAQVRSGADLKEALPIFDRHYQKTCGTRSHLYPHVRETLQTLREQGCRLAVVTNKEERYTHAVLRAHGLQEMFDLVISGDTFSNKKPDPVGIFYGLALWGVSKSEALFIGDSSIDAATARNAGVPVWLLPYGYNMGQPVQSCAPDRVIEDFSEVL
ncbi:phosphoglycolate phosphatase [Oxalobacteraceae bacterium R-40]|uniref:phosphoglycolate phosphatase n=1 Tax=Keguizhuia sedimenti TaxID=3064264 RepID=A0ABU1BTW3_9BURK|nr:phosphoglycolate phosphatase [Oxalobacteraceae bacterium R-40]